MFNKLALLVIFSVPCTSCSLVTEPAKEAAKDWWDDNGKKVVTDAADAAKEYWEEHREEIINSAIDAARDISDKSVEAATAYVDAKLQAQRDTVVNKLIENGAQFEQIDTDKDGYVSDEELQAYVTANPMALWYAGGALAGWWGLWQLRKRMPAGKAQQPES